jgi:hypothetical protein
MSRIEDIVCEDIKTRAELGLKKYGVTMEREDLTETQWLQHAYEEALDLAVYLKRVIDDRLRSEAGSFTVIKRGV